MSAALTLAARGQQLLDALPSDVASALRSAAASAAEPPSKARLDEALRQAGVGKLGHRLAMSAALQVGGDATAEADTTDSGDECLVIESNDADAAAITPPPTAPVPPLEERAAFRVLLAYVNVRSAPSTDARILARRFQHEVIDTDAQQDGWVRTIDRYGSSEGWLLVDGSDLGVGALLEPLPSAAARDAALRAAAASAQSSASQRYLPLITRPPKPATVDGPLPPGVEGPVSRWRAARPMVLVHGEPSRSAPVIDVCLQEELVWSGVAANSAADARTAAADGAAAAADSDSCSSEWVRMADPDGWVHMRCPAGFAQLTADDARHRGRPQRELEALDLYVQARVAVFQTHGPRGRLELPKLFSGWEAEALELSAALEARAEAWEEIRVARSLNQASPFAQALLASCHRDVVLTAQHHAKAAAALPAACQRERLPGEVPLTSAHVAELRARDLLVIDGVLPDDVIRRCCVEAEALDVAGHLAPPAMHRALGDRRDRLVGLEENSALLPRASALGQLVAYLRSLAFDLGAAGYDEPLTVPTAVMLACYDGQGAFYKPHMDSMGDDPRRLTAIVYLVPPDWDAEPDKDGGRLVWWRVDERTGDSYTAADEGKQALEPKAGRLVLFKSCVIGGPTRAPRALTMVEP